MPIVTIGINRPEKRNSVDTETSEALKIAFQVSETKRISVHKKSAHHFSRSLSKILIYTVLCYMVLVVTFVLDMTLR